VGESPRQPFQLSFNAFPKIDFQGSHVTSYGGLILVRELATPTEIEPGTVMVLDDSGALRPSEPL